MPVFRVPAPAMPAALHQSLLERLKRERRQPSPSGEPLIFEIPVEEPDRIDVLVVWQEWDHVPSLERTKIILEAFDDQGDKVSQAVGATYDEAMQQQLLPYSIVSRFEISPKFLSLVYTSDEEADKQLANIRQAMLELGGAKRMGDKVDLRFPTWEMAEQALSTLLTKLPNANWLIECDSAMGTLGQ
jgi:hypothetical protein